MKTIGLIGGMSWESTSSYYQYINQEVKTQLGGLHSAQIVLVSVDFAQIEQFQRNDEWDQAAQVLADAAKKLEKAGADFFAIATNTMHKVASQVEQAVSIPLVHIADATGEALVEKNIERVGLLGTAFTMEQPFYKQRIEKNFDMEVIVPNGVQRRLVHDVIYQELCLGVVSKRSTADFETIIDDMREVGAQGVILGCTEIGMLVDQNSSSIPIFDTTKIHAKALVKLALS